jgi:hypothetical protein
MYCKFAFIGECEHTGIELLRVRCSECGRTACVPKHGHGNIVAYCKKATTTFGPGSELKAILSQFGIVVTPDCKCNSRAVHMDKMEAEQPGWCEANIEEIVGWLREAAEERGLPFLDLPARLLVRRAIHNARKAEARRARGSQRHD